MIFYSYYDIKISKFSQILKDSKYVCKIPMAKFICEKVKEKIIIEQNKSRSTGNEEDKKLIEDFYKTSLYARINMYELLYKSLFLNISEEGKKMFKEYFHKDYNKDALNIIKKKIDRLMLNYEAVTSKQTQDKEFDFDEYIEAIELTLDNKNIKDSYLFQFPAIEKAAIEVIENRNKT